MVAARLKAITADAGMPFIYKSSYDKANRSSIDSYRGPGLKEGLRILRRVKEATGLPVLSDVHDVAEVGPAAEVLDVLQIPAFLCRQTDLLLACGRTGKPVNVKKGQFLAPRDMGNVAAKIASTGNQDILLTERPRKCPRPDFGQDACEAAFDRGPVLGTEDADGVEHPGVRERPLDIELREPVIETDRRRVAARQLVEGFTESAGPHSACGAGSRQPFVGHRVCFEGGPGAATRSVNLSKNT